MNPDAVILRGKRILICEDEGMIQMQWKKLLDFHGATVVGFTPSGEDCVDLALRDRPDIILMDVTLKDTDGWEASRRILQSWETCIVMVTAQRPEYAQESLKNIPISGFIQKPIGGGEFIQELIRFYMEYGGVDAAQ